MGYGAKNRTYHPWVKYYPVTLPMQELIHAGVITSGFIRFSRHSISNLSIRLSHRKERRVLFFSSPPPPPPRPDTQVTQYPAQETERAVARCKRYLCPLASAERIMKSFHSINSHTTRRGASAQRCVFF